MSASIGPEPLFRWTLGDATHNPSGLQVLACGGKAYQSPIEDVRASLSHLGFKLQKMGGGVDSLALELDFTPFAHNLSPILVGATALLEAKTQHSWARFWANCADMS